MFVLFLEKFGLLLIATSGHTDQDVHTKTTTYSYYRKHPNLMKTMVHCVSCKEITFLWKDGKLKAKFFHIFIFLA